MSNYKSILLFTLFVSLLAMPHEGQAQKWKEALQKAKDKLGEKAEELKGGLLEGGKELLEARKTAMDTATYNYSISMSDNAGLYSENSQVGKLALNLSSALPNFDAARFERSMDMNRRGEQLYRLHQYKLAGYNYFSSLLLYAEGLTEGIDLSEFKPTKKNWQENLLKAMLATEADTEGFDEGDYFAYSRTLDNLAQLLHQKGRSMMAEKAAVRALKLREENLAPDHPATIASYNNVGVLLQSMGRFTEAEVLLTKATKGHLDSFGPKGIPYAISLNNQAMLYQSIGKYQEAKDNLQTCISIFKEKSDDDPNGLAQYQVHLALIHQDLKEYEEAKAIYEELLQYYEKRFQLGTSAQEAYVLDHAASLYLAMGDAETAGEYLKKALRIYQNKYGKESAIYATTLHHQSLYHAYLKQWGQAKVTGMEAMKLREQLFSPNHPNLLQSMKDMGIVHWELKEYAVADGLFNVSLTMQKAQVEKVFPAMNEYEKGRFWAKIRPNLMLFYNYALDRTTASPELLTKAFNMHLKTKGLLLSATTKVKNQILNGEDENLKKRYTEWLDQKEQLALYYSFSKEELKSENINLDSLEQLASNNEKSLAKMTAGFSDAYSLPSATMVALQKKLDQKEVAMEIIQVPLFKEGAWKAGGSQYVALIVRKEQKYPQVVVLENGKDLDTKFARFYRAAVTKQIEDTYSYPQFWEPIAKALGDVSKVYLSVDGIYNQINVNTLRNDDGKYVLDMLEVHLLSSTRQLLETSKGKKGEKKEALLVGFPDYGDKGLVAALPGTAKEIVGVSEVLGRYDHRVQTLTQKEASETLLKKYAQKPHLLHIATHGFFLEDASPDNSGKVFGVALEKAQENPMLRAGLMLYNAESTINSDERQLRTTDNGILTAFEVSTLSLEGTELVVLSACETGLGEVKAGEGVYGLQRAFQVAGAEALIMSLWKVSDEATQQLMQLFYQNWMQSGNKEQAFSQAQRQLKQSYPDPYYWGAFVLLQ